MLCCLHHFPSNFFIIFRTSLKFESKTEESLLMQSCHNISSTPQSCVFNRNGFPNFPSVVSTFLFLSSCLLPHFYLPLSRLFSRLVIAFRPSLAISTNAYEESRHGVRLFWCARKKAGAREIRRKGGDETRENCCPEQPEIAAGSVIRSSTV